MRARWFPFSLMALLGGLALAGTAAAQAPAVYAFETPPFTLGATTPFPTVAPDSGGPVGFTTSFTNSPNPTGVTVSNTSLPGMTGQFLFVSGGPQQMTLSFSQAVFGISVNFVYNSLGFTPPARFEVVTPVGTFSAPGSGSPFPNGNLTFATASPFFTADIRAFNTSGNQVEWAIDNLTMSFVPVPEPTTLALFGLALAGGGYGGWRQWTKRRNVAAAANRFARMS